MPLISTHAGVSSEARGINFGQPSFASMSIALKALSSLSICVDLPDSSTPNKDI